MLCILTLLNLGKSRQTSAAILDRIANEFNNDFTNVTGLKLNRFGSLTANRQDYLETVLNWISDRENCKIEDYMSVHQHDSHATPLWQYFQRVINWVQNIFPKYRKEMKGLNWGVLYNIYGDKPFNPQALEEKISALLQDDDVTKRSGIYEYLLSGNEKYLNIRAFTDNEKRRVYERQNGVCPLCEKEKREKIVYDISEMEADHITPWCEGGKTVIENCQMLCKDHNRRKSNR